MTREELLREVWGHEWTGGSSTSWRSWSAGCAASSAIAPSRCNRARVGYRLVLVFDRLVPSCSTIWSLVMGPTRQGTPFPFEGPVPPELLIDRAAELDLLARRAGDRVGVRLVAPRRYGKTSLLLAHAARLGETGWRTAHVDFSRVADLTDVARRLAAAYAHLDGSWIRSHLGGLLARLGVSLRPPGRGSPRPAADDPDARRAEAVALPPARPPEDAVGRATQAATLVVFDEFQDLLVARKDLDGLLRSRIQYHGDAAAYVYAGSEPSMMRELFDTRERPLFGQADPLTLAPLPIDETLTDLAEPLRGRGPGPGRGAGRARRLRRRPSAADDAARLPAGRRAGRRRGADAGARGAGRRRRARAHPPRAPGAVAGGSAARSASSWRRPPTGSRPRAARSRPSTGWAARRSTPLRTGWSTRAPHPDPPASRWSTRCWRSGCGGGEVRPFPLPDPLAAAPECTARRRRDSPRRPRS